MLKQKTLKDSFSLRGKGLHTGLDLTVTFNPAPENHGYKIQRIDVEGHPVIDAVADNVTETTRGTVLAKNGVKVSTVEHGMAALYALGIDNCLIQVNGPEFPILDGSARTRDRKGRHRRAKCCQGLLYNQIKNRIPRRGDWFVYHCIAGRKFQSERIGILRFYYHP